MYIYIAWLVQFVKSILFQEICTERKILYLHADWCTIMYAVSFPQCLSRQYVTTYLYLLKHDYIFRSAQTIIWPPLQTFQNKVKYRAVIIRPVRSHLCYNSYYNVNLYIILPCESNKHSGLSSTELPQCVHCCLCITVRLQG